MLWFIHCAYLNESWFIFVPTWTLLKQVMNCLFQHALPNISIIKTRPYILQLNEYENVHGHSFFNLSQNLIAILCWFTCFLQIVNFKLFFFWFAKVHVSQQRIAIKFWLRLKKDETVSDSFSCDRAKCYEPLKGIRKSSVPILT